MDSSGCIEQLKDIAIHAWDDLQMDTCTLKKTMEDMPIGGLQDH